MNDPRANSYLKQRYQLSGRPVTRDDVRLYEAIIGRRSNVKAGGPGSRSEALRTSTTRVWPVDMADITHRLREMCDFGLAQGVNRQHMAQWLRQMSDEAFRRLEEAQARIAATRRQYGKSRITIHTESSRPGSPIS